MKRENRKIEIDQSWERTLIKYKGKEFKLSTGSNDQVEIFRYGKDFFILEFNYYLHYIGFELISEEMELIQDIFIQDVDNFSEEIGLNKNLMEYYETEEIKNSYFSK